MTTNWKELYKREDNWKKYPYLYSEEKNLTFECECGKKYVSFPGLYLHFQRKHNQKISTKPEEGECLITKGTADITYKYFLSTKHLLKQETISFQEPKKSDILSKVMTDFSSGSGIDINDRSAVKAVKPIFSLFDHYLPKLELFVRQEAQIKKNKIDKNTIEELPYYFNGFILSLRAEAILPAKNEKGLCNLLLNFWKWLKAHNLTNLILEYCEEQQESDGSLFH